MPYNQGVKRSGMAQANHQDPSGLGSLTRKGHRLCLCHAATWRAKNQMGFLLFRVRALIGKAKGPCHGCTHVVMRLLASQRENLQAVSQEQSRMGDGRLANVKKALWKLKPDLMGAVVLNRMAEVGGITRLACLMSKPK